MDTMINMSPHRLVLDSQYETIVKNIKNFEKSLDEKHGVAVMLGSFGQPVTMILTNVSYSMPNTIVFRGFVNGDNVTLVQHMNQVNFLLVPVPFDDPDTRPRPIGFAP